MVKKNMNTYSFKKIIKIFLIVLGLFIFIKLLLGDKVATTNKIDNIPSYTGVSVKSVGNMVVRDWFVDGTRLLGDKKDANGVHQVYTWKTDGTDEQILPMNDSSSPPTNCHKGFAHYHPSGRFIIMTVEMDFNCPKKNSTPGIAASTNLWVYDIQNNSWTNLTQYAFPKHARDVKGALSAYFSHDGTKVLWSKIVEPANYLDKRKIFGTWELHIADFSTTGGPHLENDQILQVGDGNLFEPHGFSSDGNIILFSSDIGLEYSAGLDLFSYNLLTKKLTNLTNSPDSYDEHARFSPDGTKIIWGSSMCCESYNKKRFVKALISEVFIMNSNGTGVRKITNFHTPGSAEYLSKRTGSWPTTWNRDGTGFITAQQNYDDSPTQAWLITLPKEAQN